MSLPFSQQVTAVATCQLLGAGSGFAAHIAVGSVLTGQVWGAVAGTAGVIAMEAMGRASGCYNDPSDAPGFEQEGPYLRGCMEFGNREGTLFGVTPDGTSYPVADIWSCGEPYRVKEPAYAGGPMTDYYKIDFIRK